MNTLPLSEQDLHAYADDRLEPARRVEVEGVLVQRPDLAASAAAWCAQSQSLHRAYDAILDEPIPARLLEVGRDRRPSLPLRMAAVIAWLAVGGVVGFVARGHFGAGDGTFASLPRQAAIAHVVFAAEVRHPVEVGADQEAHLAAWLSKRLGAPLKPPALNAAGYDLVGGRLLPGDKGPVAQFMYQDARGQRLTLYVRTDAKDNRETAFRFAQEDKVGVFYWLDGKLGYALSGELEKDQLLEVATLVYRQLNP
jgi:anti-sigma factor RsiW